MLASLSGPYVAEKTPDAGQTLPPAASLKVWLTKTVMFPLLDVLPEMAVVLKEQLTDKVPTDTVKLVSSGLALLRSLTLTGCPFASLTVTLNGRLATVTLPTATPLTLIVHLPKVCAVSDSFAIPGVAGLLVTFEVTADLVQVSFPSEVLKTAAEPFARLALSTAPGLTTGPPTFPVVSTWPLAASAEVAGRIAISAVATTAAIERYLRMCPAFPQSRTRSIC